MQGILAIAHSDVANDRRQPNTLVLCGSARLYGAADQQPRDARNSAGRHELVESERQKKFKWNTERGSEPKFPTTRAPATASIQKSAIPVSCAYAERAADSPRAAVLCVAGEVRPWCLK